MSVAINIITSIPTVLAFVRLFVFPELLFCFGQLLGKQFGQFPNLFSWFSSSYNNVHLDLLHSCRNSLMLMFPVNAGLALRFNRVQMAVKTTWLLKVAITKSHCKGKQSDYSSKLHASNDSPRQGITTPMTQKEIQELKEAFDEIKCECAEDASLENLTEPTSNEEPTSSTKDAVARQH